MRNAPLVCLVTPGNVSTTPRLVKSADALAQAGYRVHVVAGASIPSAAALDKDVLSKAAWTYEGASFRAGPGGVGRRIAQKVARRLAGLSPNPSLALAAKAQFAGTALLAQAAARADADLYIGHCLAGLPVAASAAASSGKPYAFDIEDFHDAETNDAMADPVEVKVRRTIQGGLSGPAAFLTAASPLIGQEFSARYGGDPAVLLNVFPLAHAPSAPVDLPPPSQDRPARLYWFSQTIGPGRGIEELVDAMGLMRVPAELHLRGNVGDDYARALRTRSAAAGARHPPTFHRPGPPDDMARLASDADLGLSIELPRPLNRDICLTNKIFVYLLAGIPQLLSLTKAQSAIAPELKEAGILADLFAPRQLAQTLDRFLADRRLVARARARAWELARAKFCWDKEKSKLLERVARVVPLE